MGIRPGDSAPRFDEIEANEIPPAGSFGQESSLEENDAPLSREFDEEAAGLSSRDPDGLPDFDESALSDSHILGGRAMIPHHSDGSTDILKRGWSQKDSTPTEQPFLSVDASNEEESEEEPTNTDPENVDSESTEASSETDDGESDDNKFSGPGSVDTVISPPSTSDATATGAQSFGVESDSHDAPSFEFGSAPLAASSIASTTQPSQSAPPPKRANLGVVLIASVLSALTIGFAMFKWRDSALASQSSQLANLPDPVDHEKSVHLYPRDVPLLSDHVLKIGESREIGDIRVEVLRVTQQSITYQHYTGDTKQKRDNSPPVLQLWLKCTNISTNSDIAPLDYDLVFKQVLNKENEQMSNTFLCQNHHQAKGPLQLMFERPEHPLWDMVGMSLGQVLKPGESLETFLPSTEEAVSELAAGRLGNELVWRVHIRKGYDGEGKGITTLIEVVFPASDIQTIADAPPSTPSPRKKPGKP